MNRLEITRRVEALRNYMREHALAAFIFPSTDPHNGEYVPEHWMTRQWISGFNGSAGTAVVTLTDAALWTDSRYFLAATEQLEGTPCHRRVAQGAAQGGRDGWHRRMGQQRGAGIRPEAGAAGWRHRTGHKSGSRRRTMDRPPFNTHQSRRDTADRVCRRECSKQAGTHPRADKGGRSRDDRQLSAR